MHGSISPVWPPTGIAISALWLGGLGLWPGIVIGSVAAQLTAGADILVALPISIGNALEGIVGALILARVPNFRPSLGNVSSVLGLVAVAAPAAAIAGASVGVLALVATGDATMANLIPFWLTWWLGDAFGAIIVAPVVLTWGSPPDTHAPGPRWAELVAMLAGLSLVSALVFFGEQPGPSIEYPHAFIVLPFLIWAGARLGPRGAATASLLVTAFAITGTMVGSGPFARADVNTMLLLMQSFSGVAAGSALVLAAAIASNESTTSALERIELRERALLRGVPDLIFRFDRGGRYLDYHANHRDLLATPPEYFVGRKLSDVMPASIAERALLAIDWALQSGDMVTFEYELPIGDEARSWEARLVPSGPGEVTCVVRDVTAPQQVAAALRESEERYRQLFHNNPQPVFVFDVRTLAILAANDTAVRHYGYARDELTRMTIDDIRVNSLNGDAGAMERLPRPARTFRHKKKDGAVIEVEVASHAITFDGRPARIALITDVTGRTLVEEQLREAQKMDAIGRLSGGIAHDFNNLLTAVVGYSELLLETMPEGDPNREDVVEIQNAGKRATTLTRQLLAFGRKQLLTPRVLNLNATVQRLREMLQSTVGEHIELEADLCDSRPRIKADQGQIEQGIVNLVLNARDAMAEGGVLTLRTRVETVDQATARRAIDLLPGRYAVLSVADTGAGMDEETRRRVFEPFFTTKETGKGTGLGLAMVYGIVTQSGGHITIASELGRGTTVSIYLPLIEEDLPTGVVVVEVPTLGRGTETILLVEDEPAVRRIARRALSDRGYKVIDAEDGPSAIELARSYAGSIDLLLTDVVMPRMSGPELATELTEKLPTLRVLFMSGYARDAFDEGGAMGGEVNFLAKPFTPERLAARVRQVLDC